MPLDPTKQDTSKQIRGAVTVQLPSEKVYEALETLPGLPAILDGMWGAAPTPSGWRIQNEAGASSDWTRETINDVDNRRVVWRGVGPLDAFDEVSLSVRDLPFRRGSEVRIALGYAQTRSKVSQWSDKFAGSEPQDMLRASLARFRQLLDAGEIATTRGQPAGRGDGRDIEGSKDEKKLADRKETGR